MASSPDEQVSHILLDPSTPEQLKTSTLYFLLGLTGTEDGLQHIAESENYLSTFCILMNSSFTSVSSYAIKCLINLSASEEIAEKLIALSNPSFLNELLQYLKKGDNKNINLACRIFSNITRIPPHCSVVFNFLSEDNSLEDLLNIFCTHKDNFEESYHYLGSLFCNITQLKEGRRLFMDSKRKFIKRLLPFTTYMNSDVRRRGAVGALRNCCFETDYHDWLLSDDVDILIPLLLPLAGPEEFDEEDMEKLPLELQYLGEEKKREPLADIRQMLIEAINQLCATKHGRQVIKEKQAYLIMRELHKVEKADFVLHACENLVEILIGDEPEIENLKELEIPSSLAEQFEKQDELNKNI